MRLAWRWMVLAVLATLLIGGRASAEPVIAGVASVIDGDSLEIHGRQIRLHGIDAPEAKQLCEKNGEWYRCGQVAASALADRIGRRQVQCEVLDTDSYDRAVSVCFLDGEDLNAWMVRQGHAVAYRRYSRAYAEDEKSARAARRGLWAGEFMMLTCSPDCPRSKVKSVQGLVLH